MTSEIGEHIPVFVMASSRSEWYEHLKPRGSCLRLYSLLVKERKLIHQLGPRGITVLHKGVQHGCVRLVKFILVNMFDDEGYCTCRVHGPGESRLTREQLLRKACEDDITAVQMAVVSGSPKMVLLLNWAIKKNKVLEKNSLSSKGDEVTPSDATRVLIERVQERSTGNALLFSGEEWDMEGEDMRRLFEARNMIEDCDPSSPKELGPSDAEGEVIEESLPESVNDTESTNVVSPDSKSHPWRFVSAYSGSVDTESSNVVVPDVKDHTMDCVYDIGSKEIVMIPKVYDLIKRILEDPGCFEADIQEKVKMLRDQCRKHEDFEFVPVAHVFLHFVFGTEPRFMDYWDFLYTGLDVFEKIICACNEHDVKEQDAREGSGSIEDSWYIEGNVSIEGSESMLATLFKILDPRGQTILHAAFHNDEYARSIQEMFAWLDKFDRNEKSKNLTKECMNSKDGAGRTILHLMCTSPSGKNFLDFLCSDVFYKKWNGKNLDWDAEVSPLCQKELAALKQWCFPLYQDYKKFVAGGEYPILFLLAIIFDSAAVFNHMYIYSKKFNDRGGTGVAPRLTLVDGNYLDREYEFDPLQLAAFLGRPSIIEEILKQPIIKPIIVDTGIDPASEGFRPTCFHLPAIHCAALSGQVEAIKSILKFHKYDPIIQQYLEGTALHLILKRKNFNNYLKKFQFLALLHVLPNSKTYTRLKDELSKLHYDEHEPKMFSANEISCINLLLQVGIDIWTPHCQTKELPSPGPMANDRAREWWYSKVVSEVVTQKTSINSASNATSVIATLVATASFIGPLQPPLGLTDDGFLHTSQSAVRVYFVCNGLSFYFSIASILMAVLPAIPMPKESLYDELFRSQRCLKTAALLLLVAIICILTSFTCASIAVVSSEWHDKLLVGAYIWVGGGVCVTVLVVYMIRMLRMVLHENYHFRRWFAENMIF